MENASDTWRTSAYYQMAELYKATGNLAAAGELYAQALTENKTDASLRAIGCAQAASLYRYDVGNSDKAEFYFQELKSRYPASSLSGVAGRIQEYQARKGVSSGLFGAAPLTKTSKKMPGVQKTPSAAESAALEASSPLMRWMSDFLPVFVTVFADRLSKYMDAAGETKLTRRFTELEFQDLVVREVQRRFPGQISSVQTKITPEGFLGSGTIHMGLLQFDVAAKIGISVVEERVRPTLREVKIGSIPVPAGILKFLETQINKSIEKKNYPLKVKEYTLKDGYANISVERTQTETVTATSITKY